MCKCFISEMDVIVDELRENGIDIDRAALSYFINKTYHTYYNVYSSVSGKLSYEDLFTVWDKTRPETFVLYFAHLYCVLPYFYCIFPYFTLGSMSGSS